MAKSYKRHYNDDERYFLKCAKSLQGLCYYNKCDSCVFNSEKGCALNEAPKQWDLSKYTY